MIRRRNLYLEPLFALTLALILAVITPCFSSDTDSSLLKSEVSISNDSADLMMSDTETVTEDTLHNKTDAHSLDSNQSVQNDSAAFIKKALSDSVVIKDGIYIGAGISWSIGSFTIIQLWNGSLLDSLSHFNLGKESFKSDSSSEILDYIDTADLKYVIKEQPGQYNISFPVTLSLSKFTSFKKLGINLSFIYLGKTLKSIISGTVDSLSESVNIQQHLRTYGLSLSAGYSVSIPSHYFSIDGVDKSFFSFSIGASPQIIQIKNSADYEGTNSRLKSIHTTVASVLTNKTAYGGGVTIKAGFTTLRQISSTNTVEFDIFYSLSRYDYFYSNNHRLLKSWINTTVKDSDKPLSFLSNRFELSVSLLRHRRGSSD